MFNSPHSGSCYPEPFLAASRLDKAAIRRSEDSYVDELMGQAAALGAPLLKANFPRAWLDVNREPYELDPKMFDGSPADLRQRPLGAGRRRARHDCPHRLGKRGDLRRARSTSRRRSAASTQSTSPTTARCAQLVLDTRADFGLARPARLPFDAVVGARRARRGSGPISCSATATARAARAELTDLAAEILTRLGYSVSRNKPYAGGFITEHYGQPGRGLHAMQIEINRSLYMDERTLERTGGFARAFGPISPGLIAALVGAPSTRAS